MQKYLETKKKIEEYNQKLSIPAIRKNTLTKLLEIIKFNDVKNILEIGTGIGYSSFCMFISNDKIQIDTLELSEERYNIANEMIGSYKSIMIHNIDCFDFDTDKKYDLIFLDGPKREQIKLLQHLFKFSHKNTLFFIDNIFLKHIRDLKNKTSNQIKILESLDELKNYLLDNELINFEIFDIDDGFAIGSKKWK